MSNSNLLVTTSDLHSASSDPGATYFPSTTLRAYIRHLNALDPSAILVFGDTKSRYNGTSDAGAFKANFYDLATPPLYIVRGNHERNADSDPASYTDWNSVFDPVPPLHSVYDWVAPGIRFVMFHVNYSNANSCFVLDGTEQTWIETQVSGRPSGYKVVIGTHAPVWKDGPGTTHNGTIGATYGGDTLLAYMDLHPEIIGYYNGHQHLEMYSEVRNGCTHIWGPAAAPNGNDAFVLWDYDSVSKTVRLHARYTEAYGKWFGLRNSTTTFVPITLSAGGGTSTPLTLTLSISGSTSRLVVAKANRARSISAALTRGAKVHFSLRTTVNSPPSRRVHARKGIAASVAASVVSKTRAAFRFAVSIGTTLTPSAARRTKHAVGATIGSTASKAVRAAHAVATAANITQTRGTRTHKGIATTLVVDITRYAGYLFHQIVTLNANLSASLGKHVQAVRLSVVTALPTRASRMAHKLSVSVTGIPTQLRGITKGLGFLVQPASQVKRGIDHAIRVTMSGLAGLATQVYIGVKRYPVNVALTIGAAPSRVLRVDAGRAINASLGLLTPRRLHRTVSTALSGVASLQRKAGVKRVVTTTVGLARKLRLPRHVTVTGSVTPSAHKHVLRRVLLTVVAGPIVQRLVGARHVVVSVTSTLLPSIGRRVKATRTLVVSPVEGRRALVHTTRQLVASGVAGGTRRVRKVLSAPASLGAQGARRVDAVRAVAVQTSTLVGKRLHVSLSVGVLGVAIGRISRRVKVITASRYFFRIARGAREMRVPRSERSLRVPRGDK